jgi:hypothetical protein
MTPELRSLEQTAGTGDVYSSKPTLNILKNLGEGSLAGFVFGWIAMFALSGTILNQRPTPDLPRLRWLRKSEPQPTGQSPSGEATKGQEPSRGEGLQSPGLDVFQPHFAIENGLLKRADYIDLRNQYSSASDLAFGLIFPLLALIFTLASRDSAWLFIVAAAVTAALFIVSMERRHKYHSELHSLILSNEQKRDAEFTRRASEGRDEGA